MIRPALPLALVFFPALVLIAGCRTEPELVWQQGDGYRWADLREWDGSDAGFQEVSPSRSGVEFVNTLDEESLLQNRHLMNGSGVAIGDVDGDGRADLYFARLDGPNVLYRNLGGWRFEDVTRESGVAAPDRYSTGAVFADIEGDGDLDLLVTAMGGPNAAFANDGAGHFTEVTDEMGLASNLGGTTMALSDVDGDGDLDLYVSNYKVRPINDIYPPWEHSFEQTVVRDDDDYRIAPEFAEHYELLDHAGGLLRVERAEPNRFYLNEGGGRFTEVPLTDGTFVDESGQPLKHAPEDWTLTARFQDVNGDGAPDLYVCNDFQSPDYFWLGDGEGGFRAVPKLAVRKTSFSTMSVDFSDIDRDGDLDFFLTDMLSRNYKRRQTQVGLTIPMTTDAGEISNRPQAVQNALQLNRGDYTYAEIARLSGVAASDWTWSGLFLDVDLDGYEDILLATGHLYDVIDKDAQMQEMRTEGASREPDAFRRQLLEYPRLPLKNVAFRNNGDLSFKHVEDGWGIGAEADVSNALAFGDLDNDGDLDAVVNRLNDAAGLFRNEASAPRLAVRLRGLAGNSQAIGAKIRVEAPGLPLQEKEVVSGGVYLSGSDPIYTFAAGSAVDSVSVTVLWRDGQRTAIEGMRVNRILEIHHPGAHTADEGSSVIAPDSTARRDFAPTNGSATDAAALFRTTEDALEHVHTEGPFDEFSGQPLLRRGKGRLGPGLAWLDFDQDGSDDLLVGTGRGGSVDLFSNDGSGNFSAINSDLLDAPAEDDVAGIVGHQTERGARVYIAVSNYEGTSSDSSWIHALDLGRDGRVQRRDRLLFGRSAVGALSLVDLEGDGDLDLFAAGRLQPGRYPDSPLARVFVNEGGELSFDAARSASFQDAGMITAAAFGDLDGDGDQDAVLTTEWGPIRYFENDATGRFLDRTADVGLDRYRGWWNGISLGDFDADGRLDLVATNWGWNGEHERLHVEDHPIRLYYGDFNSDRVQDVVEAVFEPSLDAYVPVQDLTALSEAMPHVSQRTPTYKQYASSTLREIIGFRIDQASIAETNTLAHMIFLNRRDEDAARRTSESTPAFEGAPLPLSAQISTAFAPVVSDFDGDGHEDVFLSHNFFDVSMQVPRQDAGRGLLLAGNGAGDFHAMPGIESGIAVYGEQRAAAASDTDADGRTDLVVSQNGARTVLYGNGKAEPGIRVRLAGTSENPTAIGAVIRLAYTDGTHGPGRIISAGSGYWSQNAAVQVLPRAAEREADAVVVRWPDGHETTTSITTDATEVVVTYELGS